jgi:hypothetical protein
MDGIIHKPKEKTNSCICGEKPLIKLISLKIALKIKVSDNNNAVMTILKIILLLFNLSIVFFI